MSAGTVELLIARLRREYPASMYSRVRDHAPVGSHAWVTLDLWDALDALESSRAELNAFVESAQLVIETQRSTMAAIATERDQIRAELARLRSAPVAVVVAELTDDELDAIYPEPTGLGSRHREDHRKRLRLAISAASKSISPSRIRSDRVLKEGMIQIAMDDLRGAISAIVCSVPVVTCGVDHTKKCQRALDRLLEIELDAFRSQRAAEGGEQ